MNSTSDKKILVITIGITILLFAGFIAFATQNASSEPQVLSESSVVTSPQDHYDLENVPLDGGLVTKEYEIKNTHSEPVILRKIVTSCMCTKARVAKEGEETGYFGMEHPGDKNKLISLTLDPNQTAKVEVIFDPAAHGPQGTGPFDREVWLTFTDPAGVKTLSFSGTVIN